jgi:hypothetical protein
MDGPLDELYFKWLYGQVGSLRLKNPARTHWDLLRQLYQKEFVWVVARDDNRVADGRDLRREFLYEEEIMIFDKNWMEMGCSFLEMAIALSRHLAFMAEGEVAGWFWELMQNLGFDGYSDRNGFNHEEVDETLERVMWRTYGHDGVGGLFPLQHPERDQRNIELWYQMSAYLIELEERRESGLL